MNNCGAVMQWLSNVVVIRIILIVLLVFYHAFAIYSGDWPPLEGFPEIKVYWWLDKLAFAFMLEMFVFISGYVFGFQVRTKGTGKLKAKNLFWSKFKRLMIPCVVFSLLYILLSGDIKQPVLKTLYGLVNGVGHLWFLPMLFWCFVGIWVIEKSRLKPRIVLPLLFIASLVSFFPLPLRMGSAMYYMPFFYVGYIIQKDNIPTDSYYTLKHCITATVVFMVLFPTLTLLKQILNSVVIENNLFDNQLVLKALIPSLSLLLQIVYAFAGLWMVLVWVGYGEKCREKPLRRWMVEVGGLCFGVYLIQQFLLEGLYWHTGLPDSLGCYWLPWVGFVITLVGSSIVAYLLLKTKVFQL